MLLLPCKVDVASSMMHGQSSIKCTNEMCAAGLQWYLYMAIMRTAEKRSTWGSESNEIIWIYCLSSCGTSGSLGQSKKIHSCVIECGYESNTVVGNAVINMYEEWSKFFKSMIEEHRILPVVGHYGCMVDLFGKHGNLDVAKDLIYSMPVCASSLIWTWLFLVHVGI